MTGLHYLLPASVYSYSCPGKERAAQPSAVSSGAASGDSSACDLFHRLASSPRSSLDSQEQQSERSGVFAAGACGDYLPSPSPSHAVVAPPSAMPAAAPVSAAAAAFSAFYSTSAFAGCQASQPAPVLPVQLTIQPLDMTPSTSELAPTLGILPSNGFRDYQWHATTTPLAMAALTLTRRQEAAPAGGTFTLPVSAPVTLTGDLARRSFESCTSLPSTGKVTFSWAPPAELRSSSGGCSSDDVQSWPAATHVRKQATTLDRKQSQSQPATPGGGPMVEQDSKETRAAVATANRHSAMLRFRQKREQRSFDKKVRYASRKRLAEARPRVRGQFVKADVAVAFFAEQAAKGAAAAVAATSATPMKGAVQC